MRLDEDGKRGFAIRELLQASASLFEACALYEVDGQSIREEILGGSLPLWALAGETSAQILITSIAGIGLALSLADDKTVSALETIKSGLGAGIGYWLIAITELPTNESEVAAAVKALV